jgi:hypothetical protein
MIPKLVKLTSVLGLAAVVLTACTPPMPPEVKAALLEQTYTCVDGTATIATPESASDAIASIQGSMQANCSGMDVNPLGATDAAQIFIGDEAPHATLCKPNTTVPYAVDAAVIAVSLADAGGVAFSPATVAGIFGGKIKNWDDPAIARDNGGQILASEPISLVTSTDAEAAMAFSGWYNHLTGKSLDLSKFQLKHGLEVQDLGTLTEGSVALLPYSTFTNYSIYATTIPLAASIIVDAKLNPAGVVPDISGIGSAATQLDYTKQGSDVTVKLNYSLKPVPPQGSDVAPDPYQAIYPVNISLCGQPTKLTRAVARFLLRQDSQGSLTALVGLPETIRAESLDVVSIGLPQPKVTAPAN